MALSPDDTLVSSRRSVLATAGTTTALAGCADDGTTETRETTDPTASERSRPGPSPEPVGRRAEVSTDDDLVAALADADPGDHLVLDSGTHEIGEPLRKAANNVMITGQGIRSTTIVTTGDFPILELMGGGPPEDRRRRWTVRGLTLNNGNDPGETDLVRARHADLHRFENVAFAAAQTSGNGVYAQSCWDWQFTSCHFGSGGHPDRGTADVYAINDDSQQTNNFHFVNCRWERIQSHAIYFDSSNAGGLCRKFHVSNCKFHGQPGGHPPVYHIDGQYQSLQVDNTQMGVANTGFIRGTSPGNKRDQRNATLVSNCLFHAWSSGPALDLSMNAAAVSNNVLSGSDAFTPAVSVDGAVATVRGNLVYAGGIDVPSAEAGVVANNVITDPGGPGVATADGVSGFVVTGNVVRNGELDLSGAVEVGTNATV